MTRLVISRRWLVISLSLVSLLCYSGNTGAVETSHLKGRVLDVEGKPVRDAVIFVYNSPNTRRPPDFGSPGTDEDGRFSVTLPPGRYWVVARVSKDERAGPVRLGSRHSGEPAEIEIVPGRDIEHDFVVADIREIARAGRKPGEEAVRISGRILDSGGRPVRMSYAIANRVDKPFELPDYLSGWTGEAGYYALYLPPGKYYIGAASEFPPRKGTPAFKKMTIEGDKEGIDLVIDKAPGPSGGAEN